VGGTTDIRVDVRVIAATNRDLDRAVADETFRSDLYYRLKVVPLRIPPLRERPDDIAPLALYFVERLARDLNRDVPTLTPDAISMLEAYAWPGNVRELRNVFERALILEDADEIRPEHLPPEIRGAPPAPAGAGPPVGLPPEGLCIEEVERELIQQAIARTGGNVSRAAQLLGLSRGALRYRLEKYRVPVRP
jgi:DNA-binding NtrC family response regulator